MNKTLIALALLLPACPPSSAKKEPPPSACTRVGDSCEVSPGKLGTCIVRDDCKENCFVCQSQH